jgi:hypothetical protein
MSGEAGREYILRELIEPIRASYDYILIDTPSLSGLTYYKLFYSLRRGIYTSTGSVFSSTGINQTNRGSR